MATPGMFSERARRWSPLLSGACCGAIPATSGSAMRIRRADLVPFTVGAVAGGGFTVLVIQVPTPTGLIPLLCRSRC